MFASGTTDGDHQTGSSLGTVQRDEMIQRSGEIVEEFFRFIKLQNIILHFLVQAGLMFQLGYIKRIWKTAHVKHDIRLGGKTVFEAKGHALYRHGTRRFLGEDIGDLRFELTGTQVGRIHPPVRECGDGREQLSLFL